MNIALPNIDPRIHAVGTSALRKMNAEFFSTMGDELYLIHENDTPVAVVISYETALKVREALLLLEASNGRG